MAKKRILLADDEVDIVKAIGKRLEVAGFEVIEANDGKEALTKVQTEPFDLLVLDWMLPEMTGVEVCAQVKQDSRTRHIPVIIFTASVDLNELEASTKEKTGAEAYMSKADGALTLIEKIRSLLPA